MNHNPKPDSASLTFEQAFKRLEEISRLLEKADTPLEESFSLFEEGQRLLAVCQTMLDKAEKRLKVIQVSGEGVRVEERSLE